MSDVLIRSVRRLDLDSLGELAGSRDRADVRVQAAERGAEDMLIAVADGNVVGAVSVRWEDGCDAPNPWLYGLAVVSSVRRRGIGRALVEAGEATGAGRGAHAVSLDVPVDDEPVIAFYKGLGYVIVRRHEHRWRSIDPCTGAVTDEGTAATWIMRHQLRGVVAHMEEGPERFGLLDDGA